MNKYKQNLYLINYLHIVYCSCFFFNATAEANLFDLFGSGSLDLSQLLGEVIFTLFDLSKLYIEFNPNSLVTVFMELFLNEFF